MTTFSRLRIEWNIFLTGDDPQMMPADSRWYTVRYGETLAAIAQRVGTPLDRLMQANPHLQGEPLPGQVIRIADNGVDMPCCLVLPPVHPGADYPSGVSLIQRITTPFGSTRTRVAILAYGLPHPASWGPFDQYEGFAQVPGVISWRFRLYPTPEPDAPTWAGRFDHITARLTPDTRVQVRLSQSTNQDLGPVLLENTLNNCI